MVSTAERAERSAQTTSGDVSPQRRLVLLGASNLARGIATVVQTARAALDGPIDLLAALGHGRSYGRGSWVLGRWLPGIVDCHLWEDLRSREELPTTAIVTDVGNDILYGASNETILGWVDACLERLRALDCRVALTGIPLDSLRQMAEWEFPLFRSIFYPGCKLTRAGALSRAAQLAESLKDLADRHDVHFIEPDADWYSRDRIHIARRRQSQAWRAFISPVGEADAAASEPGTLAEFVAIRRLVPHHRTLFGIRQRRAQPAGQLWDGTRVSLY